MQSLQHDAFSAMCLKSRERFSQANIISHRLLPPSEALVIYYALRARPSESAKIPANGGLQRT